MKIIFTTIALVMHLSICGQSQIWTANDCMKYAVENSPKMKKDQAQNSINHQNYIEAIGRLLPRVSSEVNTTFNFGRGLDAETNTYTSVNSFSNNYSITGSLNLFDGLSNIARIKMEKVNKLMGKQQSEQNKDMVAYDTYEAFINLIYYKQMVELARQQLTESTDNYKQAKRMEELGLKGISDVAEMRAKEAEDTYNLTKQENLLTIGIIILKEKMNFPIDEDLVIDFNSVGFESPLLEDEPSAIDIYRQTLDHSPKALVSMYNVKSKEQAYRSSKGGILPSISAFGGYSTNFSRFMDGSDYIPFKTQLKEKRGHYVGFTLSIPLFTGFSRTANIKRSRADLTIAKMDEAETLRKLYSEIEQATADLKGFYAEHYQAKAQEEAMEVAYKLNQRKYEEGLINPIELHTSSNRLMKAKSDELQTRLMYKAKKKMIDYYKGIPFITE